ncbi:hypothetical protein Pyn_35309 [Prunus yedoensis var. nudiflora]|uniref:Uncharacterized protein n=1 Tax=Prunus yedoensis var. nudiflora TaxID=2094558 RepID=A0A314YBP1_PRUYE|nr:hypothetical protein Pyn_35309 [Prunus yedoensis var. nudiflora]
MGRHTSNLRFANIVIFVFFELEPRERFLSNWGLRYEGSRDVSNLRYEDFRKPEMPKVPFKNYSARRHISDSRLKLEKALFLSLFSEIVSQGAERAGLEANLQPRDRRDCAQGQNP